MTSISSSSVAAEPDQGTSRLLHVAHEALPRRQGTRAALGLRLCGIHTLALRQLILVLPVTNRDAFAPHAPHNTLKENTNNTAETA